MTLLSVSTRSPINSLLFMCPFRIALFTFQKTAFEKIALHKGWLSLEPANLKTSSSSIIFAKGASAEGMLSMM